MIKKKALHIKIIFKIYKNIENKLKIFQVPKTGSKHFKFANRYLFYKTLENSFQKLLSKTVFKNSYQIGSK